MSTNNKEKEKKERTHSLYLYSISFLLYQCHLHFHHQLRRKFGKFQLIIFFFPDRITLVFSFSSLALLHKCNSSRKRRDDITMLDYSHGNLSSVPEDILLYENTLEELHLEANCLQELPKVNKKK